MVRGKTLKQPQPKKSRKRAQPKGMGVVVKVGPWGGVGGDELDIPPGAATPQRLEGITICISDAVVETISFRYRDENDERHFVGLWGGTFGDPYVVRLEEPGEFITEVRGTTGYMDSQQSDVVTSLTFITNRRRRHGPFGEIDGTPFSVPVPNGGSIVAFFGRGRDYINALGVYIRGP